MTNAQRWINNYIDQNFVRGSVKKEFENDDTVKITDINGKILYLTCNLYGDIMNAKTKDIIAESNLPHDLDKLTARAVPTTWRNLTFPEKPVAEAVPEKSVRAKLSFLQSQKEKEQKKNEILKKNDREL